jgi:hypothetical protein
MSWEGWKKVNKALCFIAFLKQISFIENIKAYQGEMKISRTTMENLRHFIIACGTITQQHIMRKQFNA